MSRWPTRLDPRRSIRAKLVLGFVFLIGLACTFFTLYYPSHLQRAAIAEFEGRATSVGRMVALAVAIGLESDDLTAVAEAIEWAREDSTLAYLAIRDTQGDVFARFVIDTVDLDQALAAHGGRESRFRGATVPIRYRNKSLGSLDIGFRLDELEARITSDRRLSLLVGLLVVVFGAVASYHLAARIIRPLEHLTNAVRKAGQGDLHVSLELVSGDEVGVLGASVMQMLEKLRHSFEQLKVHAEELEQERMKAEAASLTKSQFLAVMSHEIRTPMNGVLGMAELLKATDLDSGQRGRLDVILSSGNALLRILDDILDFSKIDAGKLDLERINFDLGSVASEVTTLLGPKAEESGLDLIYRYDPEMPTHFFGDPGRIRQILLNLIGNAVKFTREGHVLIDIGGVAGEEESTVRISVEDSGIGIAPEDIEGIFDSFSQVDASVTRQHGGTGLGLAISKRLAELMGGTLGAESVPGQGSVFCLEISLPHAQEPPIALRDAEMLRGLHVLVVDDSEVNRTVLLEQLGHWKIHAADVDGGPQALATLRAAEAAGDAFDLALLDYQMPGMDGEDLARRIRSDPSIDQTPLVLLTSAGQQGDARRAAEAGFDGYLIKPSAPDVLRDLIVEIMVRKDQEARSDHGIQHSSAEVAEAAQDPTARSGDAGRPEQPRGRILLAEDNHVNQLVAVAMLEKLGYVVEVATNGVEALSMWEEASYDLILMDCQMPELDGYDATHRIRELESSLDRIPIVAMTANAMDGDREACLAAGMDDYLSKPISLDRLSRVVDRFAPTPVKSVPVDAPEPTGLRHSR